MVFTGFSHCHHLVFLQLLLSACTTFARCFQSFFSALTKALFRVLSTLVCHFTTIGVFLVVRDSCSILDGTTFQMIWNNLPDDMEQASS